MAVNDEAMDLVAYLMPLHFGVIEVRPAGAGQLCVKRTPDAWKRPRLWTACCVFPPREDQFRLGTTSSTATWACWKDEAVTGGIWARNGTAQLSFMGEVENSSVSVPHHLQEGWSRAEQANSCWKAWWDSGKLEQALARIVFVVYGVCSPRFHPSPFGEIRGQRWSPALTLWRCLLQLSCCDDSGCIFLPSWVQ